nr:Uncharacterized protein/Odorant-binding related protein [Metisa plana]
MIRFFLFLSSCILINAEVLTTSPSGVSLKPLSVCCNIPEIGNPEVLRQCTPSRQSGPCNDVQCAFEKSGFLSEPQILNKEAYVSHLRGWAEKNPGWSSAVEKAISDCVDKDLRQHLDVPCKAYDVFACTGIAMLKRCPAASWQC